MTAALAVLSGVILLHRILLLSGWHVPPIYLYTAFDARMDSLAVGCLLAISIHPGKANRFVQFVCRHWALPALTIIGFALSMAMSSLLRGLHYWNVEGFTIESILSAKFIVQMVVLADRFPWRWINWRWVRFVGIVSYSWYLYNGIGPTRSTIRGWVTQYCVLPRGLLAGLFLASASYYVVEKPFLRLKSKYEVKRKVAVPAQPDPSVQLEAPLLNSVQTNTAA